MADVLAPKRYRVGTHRLCDPAETFARVQPLMPTLGITRVADVTRLDRIGIPTWQAIRPNARSLSVSQGKGITAIAAKVSAVMESAELWHAERLSSPARVARVADIEDELGYDVFDLRHAERSLLNRGTRLDWLNARRMDGSGDTFVPSDCVSMDARVTRRWAPPVFYASSNGLASGNSVDEAALHALCELVERDGTARLAAALDREAERAVDAATVDVPEASDLLDRLARAGMRVSIYDARGPTELACFEVVIRSEDHPFGFLGAGCHLDPGVALSRALTEAAQSRLAQIAGSRDDMSGGFGGGSPVTGREGTRGASLGPSPVSFRQFESFASDDIDRDLDMVIDRVKAQTGVCPIVVDLTREDLDIPVVKVIAPGLLLDHRAADRRDEGRRA